MDPLCYFYPIPAHKYKPQSNPPPPMAQHPHSPTLSLQSPPYKPYFTFLIKRIHPFSFPVNASPNKPLLPPPHFTQNTNPSLFQLTAKLPPVQTLHYHTFPQYLEKLHPVHMIPNPHGYPLHLINPCDKKLQRYIQWL